MQKFRLKTSLTFILTLLLVSAIILNSCKREIYPPEMEKIAAQLEIQDVKKWYDTFTYGKPQKAVIFNPKLAQSMAKNSGQSMPELNVDWSNAVVVKSGEKTVVEVPVNGNFGFTTDLEKYNKDNPNATTSLVVLTTSKGRSAYFMSVVSKPGYKEKVTYVNQPRSFNGSLIYHSLQGQLIVVQAFKDGAVVGIGTPTATRKSVSAKAPGMRTMLAAQVECITYDVYNNWSVCVQGICDYHSEYIGSYTVCYDTYGGGGPGGGPGGGGGGGGNPPPVVPCIPGTVSSIGPVPMALGFGVNIADPNPIEVPTFPGDPAPPQPPAPPVPCPTPSEPALPIMLQEVNITALKPCAQTVYNSIVNLNSTGFLNIFNMFNSPASFGYNWILQDGTLPANTNGNTSDNKTTNTATTTIDLSKYTNGTDIALARTILHEAAHAYLVRYFDMDRSAAEKNFKELLDLYYNYYTNDLNGTHHEAFVNAFVQKIAQTLTAYGDSKGYTFSNSQEKTQFYQSMAWGGLEDTNAFKGLSESIRENISNILRVEQFNINGPGFNATQKGTKTGC